ncbi:MAG: high-potential iron-sulfur protein [Comamonadaceae bacterium]|nr:high-potential iron-sulfur protein [Comamonadaceae bacterium]
MGRAAEPLRHFPGENRMSTRRIWLKLAAGAAVAAPLAALSSNAWAAKNDALRSALKYQDKPNGANQCSNCLHFVPGKTAKDAGGCKILPGDTEISPSAWCSAWAKKA